MDTYLISTTILKNDFLTSSPAHELYKIYPNWYRPLFVGNLFSISNLICYDSQSSLLKRKFFLCISIKFFISFFNWNSCRCASDWTIASDWLPALIFRCDCPNFHFQVGKLANEPVIFAQTVVLFCWRNNWVLAPFSIRTKVWHLTSASTKHFGRWLFKTSFADQAIVTLPICKRRMFKLLVISLKSFATG